MSKAEQMTAEEIAELRAVCDAATPGPWHDGGDERFGVELKSGTKDVAYANCYGGISIEDADLEFLTTARTVMPRLLDEVGALRGEAERLQTAYLASEGVMAMCRSLSGAYRTFLRDFLAIHPSDHEEFQRLQARVFPIINSAE
jgi:hypothetical protein